MTRFLLDAQLSRHLARHLVAIGHEASHVYDHLEPNAGDAEIAELANRLGASVVSKDADFVDLAKRGLLQRTLIRIRVQNVSNDALWHRVEQAMPDLETAVRNNVLIFEIQ